MTLNCAFSKWWCYDSGGDLWHQKLGVPHVEGPHFKCLGEILMERIWNLAHCHTVIKHSSLPWLHCGDKSTPGPGSTVGCVLAPVPLSAVAFPGGDLNSWDLECLGNFQRRASE